MFTSFQRLKQRAKDEGFNSTWHWLSRMQLHRAGNFVFMVSWSLFFAWVPTFFGKWWRALYLGLWLKQCGKSLSVSTGVHIEYPRNIAIGDFVWIGRDCHLDGSGSINIGNECMVAFQSVLQTAGHEVTPGTSYRLTRRTLGSISLGNNVWIGARSLLRYNVTIGDNSVIGMGAVVVRDVPPNMVVGGVPARPISTVPTSQDD